MKNLRDAHIGMRTNQVHGINLTSLCHGSHGSKGQLDSLHSLFGIKLIT